MSSPVIVEETVCSRTHQRDRDHSVAQQARAEALNYEPLCSGAAPFPKRTPLFYAFLGSIAIHLGALAVFHFLPQHTPAGAADLSARARGVQLVATVRLGVVDAVPNDAQGKELPATVPPVSPPQPEPVTPPVPQPVTLAKAETPSAARDATTATTAATSPAPSPQGVAPDSSSSETATQGALGTSRAQEGDGAFTTARADYLHNPPPRYPALARQRGWQGVTVLRVQVRADGAADCVDVLKTSGYRMLDKVSVETVRGWKFSPARLGDAAVASWVEIPIRFQLVSS